MCLVVPDLTPNTALIELRGESAAPSAKVDAYLLNEDSPLVTVYNISVAEHENYFAGGVLVHNKSGGVASYCALSSWQGDCTELACTALGGAGAGGLGPEDLDPVSSLVLEMLVCDAASLTTPLHLTFDALGFIKGTVYRGDACLGSLVGTVSRVWRGASDPEGDSEWQTYCFTMPNHQSGEYVALVGSEGSELANLRQVDSCTCTAETQFSVCYTGQTTSCVPE